MELSWSTFILELVNFLVLVWILKRFLYRPVLDIVTRRRAEIARSMDQARQVEAEAKDLQKRYESRLGEWEQERSEARAALEHEIDDERSTRLKELRDTLDDERQKSQSAEQQRLADLRESVDREALVLAGRFATRLLEKAATPELQSRLLSQFLDELDAMPREQLTRILGQANTPTETIEVCSAFPLTDEQRDALQTRAASLTGADTPVHFAVDPELIAGVRLTIGAFVLGLNLHDELDGFARLGNEQH